MRVQLGVVAAGYAGVLAIATVLIVIRYMQYVEHPQDVAAAGGMYAGGDLMLEVFIACMLLVPTFVLALVVRKSEDLYTGYAKVLLGVSLTAPLCVGAIAIPALSQGMSVLGEICLFRLLSSPFVIVGLGFSRVLARFDRAKRLTLYALLIEVLTLVFMAAMLLSPWKAHQG
jgi:hypothetical protein